MDHRIYRVLEKTEAGVKRELVRATSQAQAIAHLVRQRFSAEVASAIEVAEHFKNNPSAKVHDASDKPAAARPD